MLKIKKNIHIKTIFISGRRRKRKCASEEVGVEATGRGNEKWPSETSAAGIDQSDREKLSRKFDLYTLLLNI